MAKKITKNQGEWIGWALGAMSSLGDDDAAELWGCNEASAAHLIETARLAGIAFEGGEFDTGLSIIVATFTSAMVDDLRYRLETQAPDIADGDTGLDVHNAARSALTAWNRVEAAWKAAQAAPCECQRCNRDTLKATADTEEITIGGDDATVEVWRCAECESFTYVYQDVYSGDLDDLEDAHREEYGPLAGI